MRFLDPESSQNAERGPVGEAKIAFNDWSSCLAWRRSLNSVPHNRIYWDDRALWYVDGYHDQWMAYDISVSDLLSVLRGLSQQGETDRPSSLYQDIDSP